jgi:two-component system phosphate regulon response regulator PhoB
MPMATILLVDDEQDLLDLVTYNLVKDGYEVKTARNGIQAVKVMEAGLPDALVLDLMMPHMDGLQLVREIRSRRDWNKVPVLMLTARGSVEDRIKGLEMGADDYLAKPFSQKELLLRLRAVMRRAAGPEAVIELGPFRLERETLRLVVEGERVDLTTTEFKLMLLFLQNPNQIHGRDQLLRDVWGYKDSTLTRTLDTHIKRLREKLGPHADMVQTVRGVGYLLKSPV